MRNERMMNVAMVVGIVMLTWSNQLMTSSAQPGCWERIITCIEAVETNAEVQQECCPIVLQEISNERECFCSIKPLVAQNASLSTDLSNLLSLCSVTTSFQVICPGSNSRPIEGPPPPLISSPPPPVQSKDTETAACWDDISHCVEENVNTSATDPNFDPTSPSFNMSEFLCCPLMHETAIVEKECFCTVNTFIQQFPIQAANVSFLLTACNFTDSAVSLNRFCLGGPPSTTPPLAGETPSSNQPPTLPSQVSMKKLSGLSFVVNSNKTGEASSTTPAQVKPPPGS